MTKDEAKYAIAVNLDWLCHKRGWSVYRLAKEIGSTSGRLNVYTREKSIPDAWVLKLMADALGVSMDDFFKAPTKARRQFHDRANEDRDSEQERKARTYLRNLKRNGNGKARKSKA